MNKVRRYAACLQQLEATLSDAQLDRIGAMATITAVLHENMPDFDWVGFYRTLRPHELIIGPYQGHLACLQISFERGVCGAAAKQQKTIIVDDVREFPGYIACSSSTLSEIVVPVVEHGQTIAVLDIDADRLAAFDHVDQVQLEAVVALLLKVPPN